MIAVCSCLPWTRRGFVVCSVCSSWSRARLVLVVRSWCARRVLKITDTCTQTFTHIHIFTQILCLAHSHAPPLTHSHTQTHTYIYTLSPIPAVPYIQSHIIHLTLIHTLMLSLMHLPKPTYALTHLFTITHALTHHSFTPHALVRSPGKFPGHVVMLSLNLCPLWLCTPHFRVHPIACTPIDPFASICTHLHLHVPIFSPYRIMIVMIHFIF